MASVPSPKEILATTPELDVNLRLSPDLATQAAPFPGVFIRWPRRVREAPPAELPKNGEYAGPTGYNVAGRTKGTPMPESPRIRELRDIVWNRYNDFGGELVFPTGFVKLDYTGKVVKEYQLPQEPLISMYLAKKVVSRSPAQPTRRGEIDETTMFRPQIVRLEGKIVGSANGYPWRELEDLCEFFYLPGPTEIICAKANLSGVFDCTVLSIDLPDDANSPLNVQEYVIEVKESRKPKLLIR